jgi:Tol biopolymer transport system component
MRTAASLTCSLAAIWLVAFASPGPAAASSVCPGADGTLAGVTPRGIATLTPNGGLRPALHERSRSGGADFDTSFSCDRRSLLYLSFNGLTCESLEVIDLAKHRRRRYTTANGLRTTAFPLRQHCPNNPAFLNGEKILFSSRSGGQPGTYEVDLDGSGMQRLFGAQQTAATPDGRWFVSATRSGRLFLLNARGRQVATLTHSARGHSEYENPSISPDGRQVLYEKVTSLRGGAHSRQELYLVGRGGRHPRLLASGPSRVEATFSPDGRHIAFTRTRGGNANGGNLFVLDLRHPGRIRALTHLGGRGLSAPTWARR